MIPLRLVLDTNVVISAALKPDGLQRTVLILAITKPARLYISDAILAEYREVLARPELKIRKGLRQQFLQLIRSHAHRVAPSRPIHVAKDPDDDKFLEGVFCISPQKPSILIQATRVSPQKGVVDVWLRA
jgi:putative PIN family toxin of toxin-antitoxin system